LREKDVALWEATLGPEAPSLYALTATVELIDIYRTYVSNDVAAIGIAPGHVEPPEATELLILARSKMRGEEFIGSLVCQAAFFK
jgi:hypothetical protein